MRVLKYNRGVYLLALAVVAFGVWSYLKLPREVFPEVEVPFFLIRTAYEGASPETMESLVSIPLESEIAAVQGVRTVDSFSSEGESRLVVEFATTVAVSRARARLDDALSRVRPRLPRDLTQEPVTSRVNLLGDTPVLLLALDESVDPLAGHRVIHQLRETLQQIPGVGELETIGLPEPRLEVMLSAEKMGQYRLSLGTLVQAMEDQNRSYRARTVRLGAESLGLVIPHSYADLEQVRQTVVGATAQGPVYLRDVAEVRQDFAHDGPRARLNGRAVVLVRVNANPGTNLPRLSQDLRAKLSEEAFPVTVVQDASDVVRGMVSDLESTVLLCFVVLVLVLVLFLGTTNALLVAAAVPVSALMGLLTVQLFGYNLNQMVLAAFIVVLGMLVDNGIVVVENIFAHRQRGKGRLRAVSLAVTEVGWPVIFSSATTVAAFLPLLFWPGVFGRFFRPFVLTLIAAITASLLVALTLTPVLCAQLMRRPHWLRPVGEWGPARRYARGLRTLLHRPWLVVLAIVVYLGLSVVLLLGWGEGPRFFPTNTPERVLLTITPKVAASSDSVSPYLREVEEWLRTRYPDQSRAVLSVSRQGSGEVTIFLKKAKQLTVRVNEMLSDVRHRFGARNDYQLKIRRVEQGPPTAARSPIELKIRGNRSLAELAGFADKSKRLLAGIEGVVDVADDLRQQTHEIAVNTDAVSLLGHGLSNQELSLYLTASSGGLPVADYFDQGVAYAVVLRYSAPDLSSAEDLGEWQVFDPEGKAVKLSQLATLAVRPSATEIRRHNQQRVVTVTANVEGVSVSEVVNSFGRQQQQAGIPKELVSFEGEQADLIDALDFMTQALLVAFVLIILVLLLEFNSFRHVMLVMLSALLAAAGVFWGLLLLRRPFYVTMSGVAVVSLAGVAVNNAIVMLSHINTLRRDRPLLDAVLEGCVARLRPVLLTSITTIVGLLPMALGLTVNLREMSFSFDSVSGQIWKPMGQAMVSGMSFATVMTLVAVPCCYYLIERNRPRREDESSNAVPQRGPR